MQITIQEIKNELGFDDGDVSQDELLTQLLSVGKHTVERIAGRKFCDTDHIVDDFYKFPVIIKHSPADNLVVKKTDTEGVETILVEDTDYEVRKFIIYLERAITSDLKKITLDYNIKDDFMEVRQIVKNYVKRVYKKNKYMGEKTTAVAGGGSTAWDNNITEEEILILRGYFAGF